MAVSPFSLEHVLYIGSFSILLNGYLGAMELVLLEL
jgi:hypothetical protein